MTVHEISLGGCTPEPLMGYLKALGVLRLVSEQKDPTAQGCWRDGVFLLRTVLSPSDLNEFFVDDYRPTPIVAPWNAGSGFYLKWDDEKKTFKERDVVAAINSIGRSRANRLKTYANAISVVKTNLRKFARPLDLAAELDGKTKEQKKELLDSVLVFKVEEVSLCLGKADKDDFLVAMRSSVLDDDSLQWIDAALALTTGRSKNRQEAPLLGSGGNVGNSDFSAMFAQMVTRLISVDDGKAPNQSGQWLASALFGAPARVPAYSIGQFDPGRAGGANQTQGFEADPQMNPWDFVLMCEGALIVSGAISKRAQASWSGASFPFTVRPSAVGFGSAGQEACRGETWLPLWDGGARLDEICALCRLARADISTRSARDGLDFARAISMLGVDHGISSFVRYSYQERLGQSYLANSLGRFAVTGLSQSSLLLEIDAWVDDFRKASLGDVAPKFGRALREIESAVFEFCQFGGPKRFGDVLCALGAAEAELAVGAKVQAEVRPLGELSPEWVLEASDGSVEFEIALALSGLWDPDGKVGPIRTNIEPVDARMRMWAPEKGTVVWGNTDLCSNLLAVLRKRVMVAGRVGCRLMPLASRRFASLSAISRFIAGETDDEKIELLLRGMVMIDRSRPMPEIAHWQREDVTSIPRAYALMKLLFLGHPLDTSVHGAVVVKPEAAALSLLGGGRLGEACRLACRRLRASGLVPMPHRAGSRGNRDDNWCEASASGGSKRIAAALLIPTGLDGARTLASMVLQMNRDPEITATEEMR